MKYEPRRYWERRAQKQGSTYVGYLGDPAATDDNYRRFEPLVSMLFPDEIVRVLDFGCGSGRWSALLAGRAMEYVGVDISPTGLQYAGDPPSNGRYVLLKDDALPFEDASFDGAVALWVIQHTPDADWLVWASELRRVLAPGAKMLVIDDREGTAAHMFPRPPEAVADALGCRIVVMEDEGHHWCALLVREDEDRPPVEPADPEPEPEPVYPETRDENG